MTPQQVLAESILACRSLAGRYLAGFNSLNHTRQAEGLPNHVAWSLGHCALTMHRVAAHLDGQAIPDTDFSAAPSTSATDDPTFCFRSDSIMFGSRPVDDPSIYPSFERCVQIYECACERLAAAVSAATMDHLQREVPWGKASMSLYLLAARMIFHNGMHTGQIADLRRAMRMPSTFG